MAVSCVGALVGGWGSVTNVLMYNKPYVPRSARLRYMPYALRIDDEMLALFLPPARAYLAGVTTTKRPTPRGRGRGFRLWRRRTHGCGVRSHPRRGPRHSRRAARPLGRGASTRTRTHTRARARTHAHAHAHTRTRTRTRMHTLARMFARVCFPTYLLTSLCRK